MSSKPTRPLAWYREIYHQDNYRCVYCGRDLLVNFDSWMSIQIDHVVPSSQGGSDDKGNCVTSCQVCNLLKGKYVVDGHADMDPDRVLEAAREYVMSMRAKWHAKFAPAVRDYHEFLAAGDALTNDSDLF